MDLLLLKVILSIAMFFITAICGIMPVKLLKLLRKTAALAETSGKQRFVSLLLSLLTCFSGGVFFATCFLHLLPELYDHLEHMKINHDYHWNYPIAELCSCLGFFLLFFLEEIFLQLVPSIKQAHSHALTNNTLSLKNGDEESSCSTALAEPERCETNYQGFKYNPPISIKRRPHPHSHGIRSITFVLAISFHSIVEGIAMGVQDSSTKVIALFFSLMIHKLIVAFSVGLQLARTHAHAIRWVCLSIALFALMTPIGSLLGAFVQNLQLDVLLRDWIILLLQGLAVGTFIYVTFFEVMIHERDNEHPNLLKLLLMILGFSLIGCLRLFDDAHDHSASINTNHTHEH